METNNDSPILKNANEDCFIIRLFLLPQGGDFHCLDLGCTFLIVKERCGFAGVGDKEKHGNNGKCH